VNTSTEIKTGNSHTYQRFLDVAKHEHLCLLSSNSSETLNIYVGFNLTSPPSFNVNETNIVVLSGNDSIFISDLPDKSYIILENQVEQGRILGSEVIAVGSIVLEMVDFVNKALSMNCRSNDNEASVLTACSDTLRDLDSWAFEAIVPAHQVISRLKLDSQSSDMNFELIQKYRVVLNDSEEAIKFRKIASSNVISNLTTVFHTRDSSDNGHSVHMSKLGHIFYCSREYELGHYESGLNHFRPIFYSHEMYQMHWQFKQETWVAAGMTVAALGILLCLAILTFLLVRICLDDVMEGNPTCSILLLISLIFQFISFFLFSIEYTNYRSDSVHRATTIHIWNLLCSVKIFIVSISYCTTFSLLLCRAIMLASIGSEGGFLSHVNGYLQSVICVFSTLVQVGLSCQLMIVVHATSRSISCSEIYYGNLFWGIIAYDGLLLITLVSLSPLIFRSQRNYREGILLVTGSILCLIVWTVWIPMSMFGYEWREAAIPLGMQGTALAVLIGIMIPRCFLMVRSIARADLVQALPSLTSLAFASANNYMSEQVGFFGVLSENR
jgi:bride of sevenless protein